MNVSFNWLKQYVKLPAVTPAEVALALTMSTVEVDSVADQSEQFNDIVVGKIVDITKHPQADRLSVCRVDIGREQLQVVCGGSNLHPAMLVALAKVGSRVRWHGQGEYVTLQKTKIRGIESHGMIASSNEIGLQHLLPAATAHEIVDLTSYQLPVGQPLAEALGLSDYIFSIDNKSMTHRPDLWGHYGLARELAAIYKVKLLTLAERDIERRDSKMSLEVVVKDFDACRRYSAVVVSGLTVGPSPWWLRRDLESVGINSVNNVVDATNYVMMAVGQPMHAFDYDKLDEHTLVVDTIKQDENFLALDGKKYSLPSGTITINDGRRPVAAAGIIGGADSGISKATKTVVLESAVFSGSAIRRTSQRLNIRTEASARFEKKLDPEMTITALNLVVDLLKQLHGEMKVSSDVIDRQAPWAAETVVEVKKEFIDARLGKELPSAQIVDILKRLYFGVSLKKKVFRLTVPTFRLRDIGRPEDIVEEVARLYGYGNIEAVLPSITVQKPPRQARVQLTREMKRLLALGFGYTEVSTYSFADQLWSQLMDLQRNRLALANFTSQDQAFLRTSLLPNLMSKVADNARWFPDISIFELGRIYSKGSGEFPVDSGSKRFLPKQPLHLSGVRASQKTASQNIYRQTKGMLLQLLEHINLRPAVTEETNAYGSAVYALKVHDKVLGHFGLLKDQLAKQHLNDWNVVWWDLDFELMIKYCDFGRVYGSVPKYPAVVRDVAIVVDQAVTWDGIEKEIAILSPLIRNIELFDIFVSPKLGENKKSLAFSLTFRSDDRTLESDEVDKLVKTLAARLAQKFGATIR